MPRRNKGGGGGAKIRVLLVDDTDLFSLEMMLDKEQLEIVGMAKSGEEALQMASSLDFDVAVVDYKMPGMDGLEVAEKLKAMLPAVKVVILTSYDVREVVAGNPNVDHYHEKIAIESLADSLAALR